MQWFYDGQIRRYILQTIRAMSNFVVKYGDGSLHQVPVMYGDQDRSVASILRQNSENIANSVPRMSLYISSLALDRDRLADQTFVGKINIRERDVQIDNVQGSPTYGQPIYNSAEGKNFTVERLMPTPFNLKMKLDIWSSSTDQKLQILEQILVLFNPSLELQTTDNYIDWSSLTVLNLDDINWSSKTVPVGNDSPIDVATLQFQTPIWINPPVKVKRLGVITKIFANINQNFTTSDTYVEGLGFDPVGQTTTVNDLMTSDAITVGDYKLQVQGTQAILLGAHESVIPLEGTTLDVPVRQGTPISWNMIFDRYPGKYVAGSTQIHLFQSNGKQIVGTVAINPLDHHILQVNWNSDTLVKNTGIDSQGNVEFKDPAYNPAGGNRPNSPGTFDAIINPQTYNPYRPTGKEMTDKPLINGLRFLIIEDIGAEINNQDGTFASAWGELVAYANDIIEWDNNSSTWRVIFYSSQYQDTMIWQTNIYTGIQYLWNGIQWKKSFEGEYTASQWKIVL